MKDLPLTPDVLLHAYRAGLFPMARSRKSSRIDWFCPDPRAVLPLDDRFHVRRSLAKRLRNGGFTFTTDAAFDRVLDACAEPRADSADTWISPGIQRVYRQLHEQGHAHSVEAWYDGQLAGGLYGVAIHAAFFGESMFSRRSDASQLCLVTLVERLRSRGYTLLDTQFDNPHLHQFGVINLPRSEYLRQLEAALAQPVTWNDEEPEAGRSTPG